MTIPVNTDKDIERIARKRTAVINSNPAGALERNKRINEAVLARLIAAAPKLKKGTITSIDSRGRLLNIYSFAINPETITYSGGVNYSEIIAPGMLGGPQHYVNTDNLKVSFTLNVAARRSGGKFASGEETAAIAHKGIQEDLAIIKSWFLPIIPEFFITDNEAFIQPPRLILSYGHVVINCVGKSFSIKETMHDKNLDCLIAEIDVEFVGSLDNVTQTREYINNVYGPTIGLVPRTPG